MGKLALKICHLAIIHNVFSDSRIKDKMAFTAQKNGHQVSIITSGTRDVELNGVDIIGVSSAGLSRVKVALSLWSVYRAAIKQNADIYHLHEIPLMPVGVLLRALNRKTVIMDFHEDFEAALLSKHYLNKATQYLFLYLYKVWKVCALPIFSGVILAEDSYEKNYTRVVSQTTIRNYPIAEVIRYHPLVELLPSEVIRVCYVGTITEDRGAFNLVEALNILKISHPDVSIHIDFIGPVHSDKLLKRLQAYLKEHALEESVRFLGRKPYAFVAEHITDYHAGFAALHDAPNYRGSLPTKILEYGLAGLPCIASDFPISHKYVLNGVTGVIVRPDNSEDVACALLQLFSDSSIYLQMRRKCREFVLNNYVWESEYQRLEEFYYQCCG